MYNATHARVNMGTRDKRIDAYIAKSAEFALPILTYIREAVHEAVPEVEETMKWSFPHFDYKGMMCSMAAFKQHCAFNFWKGAAVLGDTPTRSSEAMGQFGRITSLKDLPPRKTLVALIRKAKRLNEEGVPAPWLAQRQAKAKKPLSVPEYFTAALRKNKAALATFEAFPPSKKRDYVEWVTEAKAEATREKRLATAIEWMAEGKSRNWKYEQRKSVGAR